MILVIARKGKGNQLQSCSEARFSFLNGKPAKKQTNKHKENTSLEKHFSHSDLPSLIKSVLSLRFDCQS